MLVRALQGRGRGSHRELRRRRCGFLADGPCMSDGRRSSSREFDSSPRSPPVGVQVVGVRVRGAAQRGRFGRLACGGRSRRRTWSMGRVSPRRSV